MLHPVNIAFNRLYLLFDALDFPSCRIRWAELFPGSNGSNRRLNQFMSQNWVFWLNFIEQKMIYLFFFGSTTAYYYGQSVASLNTPSTELPIKFC